jgi:predicted enzyme related to lactoylglutathione lyase
VVLCAEACSKIQAAALEAKTAGDFAVATTAGHELGLGSGQNDKFLSQYPAKYRPHRPQSADFQGFHAGGTITGYRPPVDRYRALRQVPTAYRPPRNVEFCRSFIVCAVPAVGAVDTLTTFTGTSALCTSKKVVALSFREGELSIEVLSSRVLVRPTDFERSFRFYAESLGLHVYREWSSGSTRGVVFFLGGGFLELSGSSRTEASESVGLWLQVRDVDAVGHELEEAAVDIIEPPTDKPWGLREMQIRDPDGLRIVIVGVPETHPLRRR